MSKFCGNCGAQMDDNAVVCGNCGCKMSDNKIMFTSNNPKETKAKKGGKKKIIVICSTLLVVVLIVVISLNFIGGRSYKSVVDTFFEASMKEPDAIALFELFPEKILIQELRDEEMSRTEAIKEFQDSLDSSVKKFEKYCDDWSVSWEIIDTVDASKSEVKYLSADYEDLYDFKVSAKKDLTLKVTINMTIDGESKTEVDDFDLNLIKSGKSWYLLGVNGSIIGTDDLF